MSDAPSGPVDDGGAAPIPPPGAAAGTTRDDRLAWGVASHSEHRWPASIAVMVAIVLQVVLPNRVIEGMGPAG